MLWVKLQVGVASRFWLELQAETEIALQQIKGLELGALLFTEVPVRIIDTRYSKHPTEPTFDIATIQQIVKEQRNGATET